MAHRVVDGPEIVSVPMSGNVTVRAQQGKKASRSRRQTDFADRDAMRLRGGQESLDGNRHDFGQYDRSAQGLAVTQSLHDGMEDF